MTAAENFLPLSTPISSESAPFSGQVATRDKDQAADRIERANEERAGGAVSGNQRTVRRSTLERRLTRTTQAFPWPILSSAKEPGRDLPGPECRRRNCIRNRPGGHPSQFGRHHKLFAPDRGRTRRGDRRHELRARTFEAPNKLKVDRPRRTATRSPSDPAGTVTVIVTGAGD